MALKVAVLGNGNAAFKHKAAYMELPELWELTSPSNCNVMDICTPSHQHFGQVLHWLTVMGKHVIVEKPMCGSLAQVDELVELTKSTGKQIFPIFQLGTDTTNIVLRWKRDDAYWAGWRGKWDTALGGCLTTHGIHALHALNQHHGPFKEVDGYIGIRTFSAEVEDYAFFDFDHKCTLQVRIDREGGPSTDLGDNHTGYIRCFKGIHNRISSDLSSAIGHLSTSVNKITMEYARNTMELLTACYYSAYTGEPVKLPIESSHPFYQGWQEQMQQRLRRFQLSPKTPE